jgi:hypothetical protein
MKLLKLLQDCGISPSDLEMRPRDGTDYFFVSVPTEAQLTAVEALTRPIGERQSDGTRYKLTARREGSTYTDKFGREASRKTNSINVRPVLTPTADDL